MKKIKIIILSVALITIVLPLLTQAAGFLPKCAETGQENKPILATDGKTIIGYENPVCGVCEIVETGINIFKWIMGMIGGAALLMFVWHGIRLMFSRGREEKVKEATAGLAHTVIGLLVIFFSWIIVNSIIIILTNPQQFLTAGGVGKLFDSTKVWNEYCPTK